MKKQDEDLAMSILLDYARLAPCQVGKVYPFVNLYPFGKVDPFIEAHPLLKFFPY